MKISEYTENGICAPESVYSKKRVQENCLVRVGCLGLHHETHEEGRGEDDN